jgi:hypothetical protein
MESIRERDLHKSLKLFLKECEKGLSLFIDLRLKSSNLKDCPRITLSGRNLRQHFWQWGKTVALYDLKNLSRMRISIPFTRSKVLSLLKNAVAP